MLERTLRWIVLGGIFALPFVCLLVTSSLFFPYITGKNFVFRVLVEILTGAWLALALVFPSYRPRRSWVLAAIAAFVLIIGIADVFGAYAFKSLWSNYERMDGWVTIAHFLAYTVVAASVLTTEKLWRWLFYTTLSVSAYVSFYGILQVTGKLALGLGGQTGLSGRIDATFGNPIYLAVYMLFHIFIAAMLWAQQWVEKGPGKRLYISVAYGSVIVLDTIALLLTGTRGTIIGLVGGALITAALLLVLGRNSRNVWRMSAAAVAGIIILGGAFWSVRDAAWIQKVGFLQRMASISLTDQTVESRFVNWSIAWEGVKERPILGWGQENYALVFDKYYDPRMYKQEQWFDRVHNIVFDWLVAGGFLGFFAYISIFLAALWALWRSGGFSIAERSLLTGLLAGYFAHNFFVFDNVTSYILFGTILAFIAYRASSAKESALVYQKTLFPQVWLPYVALGSALLVLVVAWGVNQRPLAANKLILKGLGQQGDVLKNLASFQASIDMGTYGMQEAREQLAQITAQVGGAASVTPDIKQRFFDAGTSEMQKQADMSPLDARHPLFLGVIYQAYGRTEDAKVAYEKALSLSPKKQTIIYELGSNALARGDLQGALAYFKQAYELEPQNMTAAIIYAAAAIQTGQGAIADQLLAPYIASGEAADPRILSAYTNTKQLSKAIPLWEARIKAQPGDMQSYFTLAAIHYSMGNPSKAIAILEEAKRVSPSVAAQADPVIESIKNGTAVVQ